MTCGRKKAFIGAVVGAGLGVAKGVAGIISKRKQAQKQQQQDYINTVLQARGAMTTDLNNNESLQEDFESKFVMKCGGRKRSACGKAVRMACGGRKKAELGTLKPLTAPAIGNTNPINNINSLNKNLQSYTNKLNTGSSSTTITPSSTGGQAQSAMNLIGDVSNTAGKIEASLGAIGSAVGTIGSLTGKFRCGGKKACGGRRKALAGFSAGMQLGSMVGDIGQMFVKGPQKTEAPAISTRTQRLTNLNQAGTNSIQTPANNVVTTNTNSAAPIPTIPLSNMADANLKRCGGKQAKFGTSRRRCGFGISLAYKSSRNK